MVGVGYNLIIYFVVTGSCGSRNSGAVNAILAELVLQLTASSFTGSNQSLGLTSIGKVGNGGGSLRHGGSCLANGYGNARLSHVVMIGVGYDLVIYFIVASSSSSGNSGAVNAILAKLVLQLTTYSLTGSNQRLSLASVGKVGNGGGSLRHSGSSLADGEVSRTLTSSILLGSSNNSLHRIIASSGRHSGAVGSTTLSSIRECYLSAARVTLDNRSVGRCAIRPSLQRHRRLDGYQRLELSRHLHVDVGVGGHGERIGCHAAGVSLCVDSRNRQLFVINPNGPVARLHHSATDDGRCRQVLCRQVVALCRRHRQRACLTSRSL